MTWQEQQQQRDRAIMAATLAGNLYLGDMIAYLTDPDICRIPKFSDVAKSAVRFTDIILEKLNEPVATYETPDVENS